MPEEVEGLVESAATAVQEGRVSVQEALAETDPKPE